jgi:hypothetical protein
MSKLWKTRANIVLALGKCLCVTLFYEKESVATPLWGKCEVGTHTLENGSLESSETPKISEDNCRGQNTFHWAVIYIIGKVLKCRCPKWPHMSYLDIYSPSYGQKKGWESNCQFDSRPLKVGNRPESDVNRWSETWRWKALEEGYKFDLDLVPIKGRDEQSPGSPNRDSFGTPLWESREKVSFECSLRGRTQRILYEGRWWLSASGGFPRVRAVVSWVSPKLPVACPNTKRMQNEF